MSKNNDIVAIIYLLKDLDSDTVKAFRKSVERLGGDNEYKGKNRIVAP